MSDKKLKQLTKKEKAQIWAEIDNEGLGYWCQNYGEALNGTEWEPFVTQARVALDKLDEMYSSFEEFAAEE